MSDYEPEPGEARWSVWLNRHPRAGNAVAILLLVLGALVAVARLWHPWRD